MKIILLNGPAGSGKNTVGKIIEENFKQVYLCEFAETLKDSYAIFYSNIFNVSYETVRDEMENRETKEKHRKGLINFGEGFVKPTFGRDFFGKQLLKEIEDEMEPCINQKPIEIFVVTDCGFQEEVDVILANFPQQVEFIRIVERGSFKGDSRGWVKGSKDHYHIHNVGTIKDLETETIEIIKRILDS